MNDSLMKSRIYKAATNFPENELVNGGSKDEK